MTILKIVNSVLCVTNLAIFISNPSENMVNGIICGMLFTNVLWLIGCD